MSNNDESALSVAIGKLGDKERRKIMRDAGVPEDQLNAPISDTQIADIAAAKPSVAARIESGAAQAGQLPPGKVQVVPAAAAVPDPQDPDTSAPADEPQLSAEGAEPSQASVEDGPKASIPGVRKLKL